MLSSGMGSIEDWDIGTPVHLGPVDRERVEVSVLRMHDVEGGSRLAVPDSPPNTALQLTADPLGGMGPS